MSSRIKIYYVLAFIFSTVISCKEKTGEIALNTERKTVEDSLLIPDKYDYAKLEDVEMDGAVGTCLKKIIDQRISSDFAANEIATEATKAFEIRMDDQFYENRGLWQGEFWGKWVLSAVAAYQYTGNEHIKATIKKETDRLIATQDENGYIGSYKNSAFVAGDVWNVWNRKYALWGLVETYELLKDPAILKAAQGMMDQLITEVGPDGVPMVDTGNFYGLPSSSILTPLVKLYLDTKDKKYLDYAKYIVANWNSVEGNPPSIVEKGLTGTPVHEWFPEKGKWTKAYEFISCVEGLVDLYQVVGNEDYINAAKNIYTSIQKNERVITGGIGYHDKLVGASSEPGGLNEPCDVVYWERLSAKLLALTGEQTYADEIERLTYNVLLASFNYEGDWGVRRLGLNEPHLVSPLHAFTHYQQCCVANVPRGMLQLGEVAVMSSNTKNELLVNLYLPGNYAVMLNDGKKASFEIDTEYPKNGVVNIAITSDEVFKGELTFRNPDWCTHFSVQVNGYKIKETAQDGSFSIERSWKKDDKITINMDVGQRIIEIPGREDFKAIMWGPVVLARSSMLEPESTLDTPIDFNGLKIKPTSTAQSNNKIWMEFTATTKTGKVLTLCDYSSTGREYERPKDPTAWEEMIKKRVGTDQRVWLKTR